MAHQDIETAWPVCLPHVRSAIDRSAGHLTAEAVLAGLRAGEMHLWMDREAVHPVVGVTTIQTYDAMSVLFVVLIGGRGIGSWLSDVEASFANFAVSHGCCALEALVRPGMIGASYRKRRAALRGWRPHGTLIRKPLVHDAASDTAIPLGVSNEIVAPMVQSLLPGECHVGNIMRGVQDAVGGATSGVAKVIGKNAELPKEVTKLSAVANSLDGDYQVLVKSLAGVSKEMADLTKSAAQLTKALDTAIAAVEKATFGLDPKKPDDKKKISAAQDLFLDPLQDIRKDLNSQVGAFDKLSTVVANAGKSKGLA